MRILFVCNPLYGHLNPMLPLARAAHHSGHAVVVATGADLASVAQREGLTTWSVGMTHAQAGGNQQASWLDYFEASARARLADLRPRCTRWRPELVVHEETELAGPVIAASVGARSVMQGLGPTPPARLITWFADAIARLAPQATASEVVRAWRAATYIHPCPPGLGCAEDANGSAVLPLRPTIPGSAPDRNWARRIELLPCSRSVFVTLGTVYSGNTAALAAAIEGLHGLAVNVIVAVGPQGEPSAFEGYGAHVLVERLVPLASVLQHCSAVVSQGGSGVMLAAMSLGLPQLMLPQGADQFRNAELGARTGAALALLPQDATATAIRDSVLRLLSETAFKTAAHRLRDQIGEMPDAEAVVASITADRPLTGDRPAMSPLGDHAQPDAAVRAQ